MWLELAKSNKNRKQKFLEEMNKSLPWETFVKLCGKYYKHNKTGRPKTDLLLLLKIYFLQQWYNLGDPTVEAEIYDSIAFRTFLGIDLIENIPDETVICRFRHFLEKYLLPQKFFKKTTKILKKKGFILQTGTIVDATIIKASSSTKNKDKKRDREMSSTKKNNNFHFGMKVHIGVDMQKGLIHKIETTTAKVHDGKMLNSCLHGQEKVILGDKAYGNKKLKQEFRKAGKFYWITDKATRSKKLSTNQRKKNRKKSSIRSKVEHPFLIIKHLWKHTKVRYKGLLKNNMQWNTLAMLSNFYKIRYKFIP